MMIPEGDIVSLKAQVWQLWVCEGMLGATHGMFYPISEIYFPALKLAMNETGFYVWDADRYQLRGDEHNLDPEWSEHQPKLLEEREITDAELITMVQRTAAAVADEPQLSDKLQELFADHFES